MNKKYFDMGSHNPLDDWNDFIDFTFTGKYYERKIEWPVWLTCPVHYQVKRTTAIFITTPLNNGSWLRKRFLESK